MLTPEEISNLKPGDQLKVVDLPQGWDWYIHNGTIVTVKNPALKILGVELIEFEPSLNREYEFEGRKYGDSVNYIDYKYVELIHGNHKCNCPITILISIGCQCNGI